MTSAGMDEKATIDVQLGDEEAPRDGPIETDDDMNPCTSTFSSAGFATREPTTSAMLLPAPGRTLPKSSSWLALPGQFFQRPSQASHASKTSSGTSGSFGERGRVLIELPRMGSTARDYREKATSFHTEAAPEDREPKMVRFASTFSAYSATSSSAPPAYSVYSATSGCSPPKASPSWSRSASASTEPLEDRDGCHKKITVEPQASRPRSRTSGMSGSTMATAEDKMRFISTDDPDGAAVRPRDESRTPPSPRRERRSGSSRGSLRATLRSITSLGGAEAVALKDRLRRIRREDSPPRQKTLQTTVSGDDPAGSPTSKAAKDHLEDMSPQRSRKKCGWPLLTVGIVLGLACCSVGVMKALTYWHNHKDSAPKACKSDGACDAGFFCDERDKLDMCKDVKEVQHADFFNKTCKGDNYCPGKMVCLAVSIPPGKKSAEPVCTDMVADFKQGTELKEATEIKNSKCCICKEAEPPRGWSVDGKCSQCSGAFEAIEPRRECKDYGKAAAFMEGGRKGVTHHMCKAWCYKDIDVKLLKDEIKKYDNIDPPDKEVEKMLSQFGWNLATAKDNYKVLSQITAKDGVQLSQLDRKDGAGTTKEGPRKFLSRNRSEPFLDAARASPGGSPRGDLSRLGSPTS